jgi:hypothetical protein
MDLNWKRLEKFQLEAADGEHGPLACIAAWIMIVAVFIFYMAGAIIGLGLIGIILISHPIYSLILIVSVIAAAAIYIFYRAQNQDK